MCLCRKQLSRDSTHSPSFKEVRRDEEEASAGLINRLVFSQSSSAPCLFSKLIDSAAVWLKKRTGVELKNFLERSVLTKHVKHRWCLEYCCLLLHFLSVCRRFANVEHIRHVMRSWLVVKGVSWCSFDKICCVWKTCEEADVTAQSVHRIQNFQAKTFFWKRLRCCVRIFRIFILLTAIPSNTYA